MMDDLPKDPARCPRVVAPRKRVDGRSMDDPSPSAEVGLLPAFTGPDCLHGQTQALTTVTLGTISDQQKLTTYITTNLRDMHHYNFRHTPFERHADCVFPTQRDRHGAQEKALEPVIPSETESLQHTSGIRNPVLERFNITGINLRMYARSDGRRVLSAPVAGISCGLISDGDKFNTFRHTGC